MSRTLSTARPETAGGRTPSWQTRVLARRRFVSPLGVLGVAAGLILWQLLAATANNGQMRAKRSSQNRWGGFAQRPSSSVAP